LQLNCNKKKTTGFRESVRENPSRQFCRFRIKSPTPVATSDLLMAIDSQIAKTPDLDLQGSSVMPARRRGRGARSADLLHCVAFVSFVARATKTARVQ
jgi:hypothetical protein